MTVREDQMTEIYWIGGAVSVFLFAYLLVALLKPEIF
jgi:K+-transporting ATPase KdpF subunit